MQKRKQYNKKNQRSVGARYEQVAGKYLEQQGYQILQYNYRCRQGEIDIIARDGEYLVFCEVKYRNNSHIPATDAIAELCKDESAKVTSAFLITKHLEDFGIAKHETHVPILRVPAIAFLYLLGKAEADGQNGKM